LTSRIIKKNEGGGRRPEKITKNLLAKSGVERERIIRRECINGGDTGGGMVAARGASLN